MTTQDKIVDAAARYGVPSNIALAVARAESGYNQAAVSGAGAIGVMQLTPATAAGLNVNPWDEDQNINGGVLLLSQLYTRYGDWSLALAAYNAGPSAVDRYGGMPPFSETQRYVPTVLAYAGMEPTLHQPYDTAPAAWDEWLSTEDQGWGEANNTGLFLLAAAVAIALLA